jgi:heavy metal efflux system protein
MRGIIEVALRLRTLVVVLFATLLGAGTVAFSQLNIEAYPDPVPPFVQVVTQNAGLSAEEIERYITIPIETGLATVQHLSAMRSISLFGLSDVRLQFTYDLSYDEAQQKVLNLLSQLPELQNKAQPSISPWSPIGEIYRYQVVGPPGYSVMDLRTLQDWVLARQLRAVPGVLDVTSWGGKTKTFEIQVDFNKLIAYGLTLPQVIDTLNKSNVNVGGQTVNLGMQAAVVRGVGLIRTIDDLRNTMLTQVGGNPVRVSDIGEVVVGHRPRLGIAGRDGDDDIVQGTVLMRRGQPSTPTIERVKAEVEQINNSSLLPPGVHIERIYDRSDLISVTTHTVLHNMAFGVLLIFALQWLFLGDLRSAVIVASTIPFALFFAVCIMVIRGESANLLSVGAIDFGLIVDATVIMVERIFRQLGHPIVGPAPRLRGAAGELSGKLGAILAAGTTVSRSILFATLVIIAGFIPLFTLSGVEGHIFGPMAKTYAYAIVGGLIATFTVAPALGAILLPEHVRETETLLVRILHRLYSPTLRFAVSNRRKVVFATAGLFMLAATAARMLGLEFLPTLEEGNLWVRATMPASISLEGGNDSVNRVRKVIGSFPEIETVVSQQGRTDDGTDSSGFFNAEFNIPLAPKEKWRPGVDKPSLINEILEKLQAEFPGIEFNFSQYLQDNIAESISGVKGDNTVRIFGHDLAVQTDLADKVKAVMSTVPGIVDLAAYTVLGQPTVSIDIDRFAAGRYGLTPGDINAAIHAAIGGEEAGNVYEPGSDRFFPIVVRLAPRFRQTIETINNLTISVQDPATSRVTQIPLKEVAKIKLESGPLFIYREGRERYIPIRFSVRDRDLGSAILEAQRKIAEQVHLPPGYRLEWAGQFGNLQDAIKRLSVIVPITILLIGMLLYLEFTTVTDTLLGLSVIPMALIGGVFALYLTQIPFSVSAAIGFIALFGISAMNGIIMLSQYNHLMESGVERIEAIVRTGETQMRPVLMTCMIAAVGLLPAALSTGIGAQVQKPLAVVVVGGMVLAPTIILIALPALIALFSRRAQPEMSAETAPEPAE